MHTERSKWQYLFLRETEEQSEATGLTLIADLAPKLAEARKSKSLSRKDKEGYANAQRKLKKGGIAVWLAQLETSGLIRRVREEDRQYEFSPEDRFSVTPKGREYLRERGYEELPPELLEKPAESAAA